MNISKTIFKVISLLSISIFIILFDTAIYAQQSNLNNWVSCPSSPITISATQVAVTNYSITGAQCTHNDFKYIKYALTASVSSATVSVSPTTASITTGLNVVTVTRKDNVDTFSEFVSIDGSQLAINIDDETELTHLALLTNEWSTMTIIGTILVKQSDAIGTDDEEKGPPVPSSGDIPDNFYEDQGWAPFFNEIGTTATDVGMPQQFVGAIATFMIILALAIPTLFLTGGSPGFALIAMLLGMWLGVWTTPVPGTWGGISTLFTALLLIAIPDRWEGRGIKSGG